jgi:hypothetical protein
VFGPIGNALPAPLGAFLYNNGEASLFGLPVAVLYVIVPWIGVMMAGYGFGVIMASPPDTRRRWCLRIGLVTTALFLIVATVVAFVNVPSGENVRVPPLWVRILSQNKYPASQLFLAMTLGPAIALLALADTASGKIAGAFKTIGRVPMFYYLLHIPLIHIAALATAAIRGDGIHHEWYATAPFASVPPAARWSLGQLYLVWAIVIVILYLLCAWYSRLKAERPARWMSYI